MTARKHICDVPGCTNTRERWQRTCTACWHILPSHLRDGIKHAFRQRRYADHRQFCKSARAFLDARAEARAQRTRAASELAARLTGEHPE